MNDQQEDMNKLKEELKQSKEIIEQQTVAINVLKDKMNSILEIEGIEQKDKINYLEKLIKKNIVDLANLKTELINKRVIEKNNTNNRFANFILNENIFYTIPCSGSSTFAEIEEQLYNKYPEFRQNNNSFLVNGNEVVRFKTIDENKIDNGVSITLVKPTFSGNIIKKIFSSNQNK
jgi:predicted ester cyclase